MILVDAVRFEGSFLMLVDGKIAGCAQKQSGIWIETKWRTLKNIVNDRRKHKEGDMTVQIGFLESLEWTTETQTDFSISRLGGLPVFPLESRWKDMADRRCPWRRKTQMSSLFPPNAPFNPTLCSYRSRRYTPDNLRIHLQRRTLSKTRIFPCVSPFSVILTKDSKFSAHKFHGLPSRYHSHVQYVISLVLYPPNPSYSAPKIISIVTNAL
jgi:hypothetical protein